jgi:signal transduction histidine kinase
MSFFKEADVKLTTKLILLFIATTLSTIIIMGLFLYGGLWNDRFKSIQKEISNQLDDVTKTKNLDRTIKIHSRDEIGGLADSFNKMMDTLNQTQQTLMDAERELREHRDHLEDLVKVRTDQLALAAERAEESDRLKSVFLATMSHELRTPLNSIIGFTGILNQGLAGPLNDEQKKQLGMVQNSAHHLLELINDVLDISKIEAGQLEIARNPFDLRRSLDKVVNLVSPMAEKKGLPSGGSPACNGKNRKSTFCKISCHTSGYSIARYGWVCRCQKIKNG